MTSDTINRLSGMSTQIINIKQMIKKVATTEVNVFVTGESGTGKEIVARCLHDLSDRKNMPFVPVNCGAIPDDLLESELFGHEKGAFTGAISTRKGRFELAEGGTIFLDEIGDMPMNMQVKLLRVIQEKVFERVGGNKSICTNVRIVAATHRNLEKQIETEKFREDLFYRLNVFPVEMPSLRERIEDLPIIIHDIVARFEAELGCNIKFSESTINILSQHEWKGNIRELSNLIERLFVLHPDMIIEPIHLPLKYQLNDTEQLYNSSKENDTHQQDRLREEFNQIILTKPQKASHRECIDLKQVMIDIEKSYISNALQQTNGVVSHAAQLLSIRRTTLVEKIKKYQLPKAG
tara:strand:+ start:88973 stop:90022 length:1050 start_codon:yes stop_codon:yes gene_type:complete